MPTKESYSNTASSPRRLSHGIIKGILMTLLLCLVLWLLLWFFFTSYYKYVVAFGLPNPDKGLQTGTVTGTEAYIWECYQGKRIVVYQNANEFFHTPYFRQEAPCGGLAKIEETWQGERYRRELDPKSFWR